MNSSPVLIPVFILVSFLNLLSQEGKIAHEFKNGSFETYVIEAQTGVPLWSDCGFPNETPPTIHIGMEIYNVTHKPQDGDQYISMVTRENDTWEGISQKLDTILNAGKTYKFSTYLAKSELESITPRSQHEFISFANPIVLRVWGGNEVCEMSDLLFTSNPVDHEDWKKYDIAFVPKQNIRWITIQCFCNIPVLMPYNGNILLDNFTDIFQIRE